MLFYVGRWILLRSQVQSEGVGGGVEKQHARHRERDRSNISERKNIHYYPASNK
jgi:hypothetical protein